MIEDGSEVATGDVLKADVCLVGAGAAGITLALELAAQRIDVLLLEAGGEKFSETSAQELRGESVFPQHHAPLSECRSRQLGGTTALWVGRCLPLDPLDLDERDHVPGSGWPIEWSELESYYPQANEHCHVGAYAYTVQSALPGAPVSLIPGLREGVLNTSSIERWSLPTHFGRHYRRALASSSRINLLLNSACVELQLDPQSRRLTGLVVATALGRQFKVQARQYILAGGGLETTRMLLASSAVETEGLGNRSGHLGRHYMGHLFGSVAEIRFLGDPRQTIHGFERDRQGVYCRRRIGLTPDTQKNEGLLNTAFWPTNPPAGDPDHRNGVLSAAFLALSLPFLRDRLAAPIIQKMFCGEPREAAYAQHLRNILLDFSRASGHGAYYLYRRFFTQRRVPALFVFNPANRYDLYYHAEQSPNPDSHVTLSDERDRLGMRRLKVNLHYQEQDIDSVVRSHRVLENELVREQKVARIEFKRRDIHAHVREQACDGYHQIGTTRMAARERDGVVDKNCRVYGVENLYICSSSVFPTSGHANPTLTIVALAVRLANHLSRRLDMQQNIQSEN